MRVSYKSIINIVYITFRLNLLCTIGSTQHMLFKMTYCKRKYESYSSNALICPLYIHAIYFDELNCDSFNLNFRVWRI